MPKGRHCKPSPGSAGLLLHELTAEMPRYVPGMAGTGPGGAPAFAARGLGQRPNMGTMNLRMKYMMAPVKM